MGNVPERIWATEDTANFGEDRFHSTTPMRGLTEYLRADIAAAREADLRAEAARLRALLDEAREGLNGWLNIAAHCDITDGSCYCGEDMRNHSPAMDCGHVAVDHGGYVTGQQIKTTEATLAKIGGQHD